MWKNDSGSLPGWIEDAYEILESLISEHERGVSLDEALEVLSQQDQFSNNGTDARYAIDRLLESGWLYEVDGELRVTDPKP